MDISFATVVKKNVDITINIGDFDLTVLLDVGFFSPAGKFNVGLHNHSTYEIYLVLEGSHEVFIHDHFFTIHGGDICFLSPGIYHYNKKAPENPGQILTFKLMIPSEKTEKNRKAVDFPETEEVLSALTSRKYAVFKDASSIMGLIPEILRDLSEKPMGFYTNLQGLFMRILIHLARQVSQSPQMDHPDNTRITEEIRNEMIDGFFIHNFHQNISANNLADFICVSRRQLHRILKELYCLSFKEKLLETRIEKAKDFLRNSGMPVEMIAEKVGYMNPKNFYSVFKDKTGMTPGFYRRNNANSILNSKN